MRERSAADQLSNHPLLAAIVDGCDDTIISTSLDGVIKSWNAAAERLLGYTAAEVIGQPANLVVAPEYREQETELVSKLRLDGHGQQLESVRIAKDGCRSKVWLTVSAIYDESGQLIGVSQLARDLNVRDRAEAMLRDSNRSNDEFLAMLGHELRNPLTPLANGTLLLRRMSVADPGSLTSLCDMFDRQIGTLRRLLDELLDVTPHNCAAIRDLAAPARVAQRPTTTESGTTPARPQEDTAPGLMSTWRRASTDAGARTPFQ